MTHHPVFNLIATALVSALASAAAAQDTGTAAFFAANETYHGRYSLANKSLEVTIDGTQYRGNFDSAEHTLASLPEAPVAGLWGRAFLFASSAHIIQCRLDSGFPKLSGSCLSAEGRHFRLEAQNPS